MFKYFLKIFTIFFVIFFLFACATTKKPTLAQVSELAQGKRYFDAAYYRPAMQILLPLAVDGMAEAQYAVGYMYYYGLGVNQDLETGTFWIRRAASQHFQPAEKALALIAKQKSSSVKITTKSLI